MAEEFFTCSGWTEYASAKDYLERGYLQDLAKLIKTVDTPGTLTLWVNNVPRLYLLVNNLLIPEYYVRCDTVEYGFLACLSLEVSRCPRKDCSFADGCIGHMDQFKFLPDPTNSLIFTHLHNIAGELDCLRRQHAMTN